MKKYIWLTALVCSLSLLLSCAGLPKPKSEGNSLVIGSFALDFPDGFFDLPARTLDNNIKLFFENTTQQKKFTLMTQRGYFYFLSNGNDEFLFKSFSYSTQSEGRYNIGETKLNMKIPTTPDKVFYLGHIKMTYASPKFTKQAVGGGYFWNFDISAAVDWDKDSIVRYIESKQADSPWLDCEIVQYGKR